MHDIIHVIGIALPRKNSKLTWSKTTTDRLVETATFKRTVMLSSIAKLVLVACSKHQFSDKMFKEHDVFFFLQLLQVFSKYDTIMGEQHFRQWVFCPPFYISIKDMESNFSICCCDKRYYEQTALRLIIYRIRKAKFFNIIVLYSRHLRTGTILICIQVYELWNWYIWENFLELLNCLPGDGGNLKET